MQNVRVYAVHEGQWYRTIQDDDGRHAYVPVDESEIMPGDIRTEMGGHCVMVSVSEQKSKPCDHLWCSWPRCDCVDGQLEKDY